MAEPVATPNTIPDVFTEATEALLVLQLPPDTASVYVAVVPVQIADAPVMVPADGAAFTEIAFVTLAAPQVPDTE